MHVYEKKNKGKNVIADNILSKTACVIETKRSEHSVITGSSDPLLTRGQEQKRKKKQ